MGAVAEVAAVAGEELPASGLVVIPVSSGSGIRVGDSGDVPRVQNDSDAHALERRRFRNACGGV